MDWLYTKHYVGYEYASGFMDKMALEISTGKSSELMWLLEHPHIFTCGILAKPDEIIEKIDIPVYKARRGGKYTYHGPGQRIVYAMINLSKRNLNIREYIELLENWCIDALSDIGIQGFLISGKIGVWVNAKTIQKIAAIGVRVSKGVTMHGIAINISPDLGFFKKIVPCGVREYGITSVKDLGINITMDDFDSLLTKHFPKQLYG